MARQRDTLNAIHPPNRKVLRHLHLKSLDDVWKEIGKDLDGLDPLVQAGVDRPHLIHDLMASAVHDADEKGSWPHRHFLDLALAAAALGLVALLIWAVPRASSAGIALRDLRTGERVGKDSLHGADPDQIANRRLARDVARGGFVRPEWLAPVPALGDQELSSRPGRGSAPAPHPACPGRPGRLLRGPDAADGPPAERRSCSRGRKVRRSRHPRRRLHRGRASQPSPSPPPRRDPGGPPDALSRGPRQGIRASARTRMMEVRASAIALLSQLQRETPR